MLRIPLPEDDGFALALLEDNQALKGRQITDGGERSVTPGQPPPSPCPSLAPSAQGGGRGRVAVDRGLRFAHPRLYSVAPSGLDYPLAVQGAKSASRGR